MNKNHKIRVSKAAKEYAPITDTSVFSCIAQDGFISGAEYEHPIAKKEGFNEAIEEVIKLSFRADIHPTKFLDEIDKLKK